MFIQTPTNISVCRQAKMQRDCDLQKDATESGADRGSEGHVECPGYRVEAPLQISGTGMIHLRSPLCILYLMYSYTQVIYCQVSVSLQIPCYHFTNPTENVFDFFRNSTSDVFVV